MNSGGKILIVGIVLAAVIFIGAWVAIARRRPKIAEAEADAPEPTLALDQSAHDSVEHIFDDEFREELKNRGRLHFEKVIGENAMFLQQDLRQTTSQLNDYMRAEITRT